MFHLLFYCPSLTPELLVQNKCVFSTLQLLIICHLSAFFLYYCWSNHSYWCFQNFLSHIWDNYLSTESLIFPSKSDQNTRDGPCVRLLNIKLPIQDHLIPFSGKVMVQDGFMFALTYSCFFAFHSWHCTMSSDRNSAQKWTQSLYLIGEFQGLILQICGLCFIEYKKLIIHLFSFHQGS